MNIFVTNECPVQAAIEHCNVHLVKMATESCQILSTVHYNLTGKVVGMQPTHYSHPCTVWASKCSGNYLWLYEHYIELCHEYYRRYGKVHNAHLHSEKLVLPPQNIRAHSRTFFAKAMPDEFKAIPNAVLAYQAYLNHKFVGWRTRTDKKQMPVEWTKRNIPAWVDVDNVFGEVK